MLEVRAGSRLHFGLMELAEGQPHRFGGLGLMVQQPSFIVRWGRGSWPISSDREAAERIASVLQRVTMENESRQHAESLPVSLVTPSRFHSGLGFGTQLACAVSAGTWLLEHQVASHPQCAMPWKEIVQGLAHPESDHLEHLARWSGRGKRSAIGLHGFLYGGLILDHGHSPTSATVQRGSWAAEVASRLPGSIFTEHVSWPSNWRVVLIIPEDGERISGQREFQLIQTASSHASDTCQPMWQLAQQCLENTRARNFAGFVEALEQYTQLAGELFRGVQGGLFRGPAIQQAVELAQQVGLRGVGQSSWGPTVFGFAEEAVIADEHANRIADQVSNPRWEIIVTGPSSGAQWRFTEES